MWLLNVRSVNAVAHGGGSPDGHCMAMKRERLEMTVHSSWPLLMADIAMKWIILSTVPSRRYLEAEYF